MKFSLVMVGLLELESEASESSCDKWNSLSYMVLRGAKGGEAHSLASEDLIDLRPGAEV